jgi:hypothetical protein
MLVSSDNAIISHVDLIMAPFQMTMNQMVIYLLVDRSVRESAQPQYITFS